MNRFLLSTLVILVIMSFLSGCSPSDTSIAAAIAQTQTAMPTPTKQIIKETTTTIPTSTAFVLPELFRDQILKVLESGSMTVALTTQGTSLIEFRQQVAETKGAYDLAISIWPAQFPKESQSYFDQAFVGWGLAIQLINRNVNNLGYPVDRLNPNEYDEFIEFLGDNAEIGIHENTYQNQTSKRILFENIPILLEMAAEYFEQGRDIIFEQLK